MKTHNPNKVNDTAVRVLEVLKLMICGSYTKDELLDMILEKGNVEPVHRNETINKYFNTFKLLGAEISKISDKFTITSAPLKLDLSDDEIEMLTFFFSYSKNMCRDNEWECIENLAKNILKFTNNNVKEKMFQMSETVKEKYKKALTLRIDKALANNYEQICKDKLRIRIAYNNDTIGLLQQFTIEPKETLVTERGLILKAYNPSLGELQDFYIENIISCKQLEDKSKSVNMVRYVTFKLFGRLAMTYELKQGERIIETGLDYKVVTCSIEDKYEILRRLLRYGNSCRILYPLTIREDMTDVLRRIKSNYK